MAKGPWDVDQCRCYGPLTWSTKLAIVDQHGAELFMPGYPKGLDGDAMEVQFTVNAQKAWTLVVEHLSMVGVEARQIEAV